MGGGEAGPAYDRERTRRALESLQRGGQPTGVRAVIAASWRRCLAHGVSRETLSAPYDDRVLDPGSALVRAAEPVLDQLRGDLTSSPSCVTLADHQVRILRRVTGDPRLDARLDAVLAAPGYSWAERHVGTNALGTAIHDRELVVVHEREHYHDLLVGVCGSAVPVRDPVSGRVLGAIGIAAPAQPGDASWSALVRQTGLLVEDRLFDLHADGQRQLHAAYLSALRRGDGAVFAVGPDLLRAPPEVRRELAGLDHDELWDAVVDALTSRAEAQVTLELPGERSAEVRLRALQHRSRLVGAVGELLPAVRPLVPRSRAPVAPLRDYAGWSAPVRATAIALRRLAVEREPVCVVGEAGTGKATMVQLVAGRVLNGRPLVTLDAAAEQPCPVEVLDHLRADAAVLVRHAEALAPATLDDLLHAAEDPGRRGWLALTWRGDAEALGVSSPALHVLPLPPLRARPDDVGRAVARLLRGQPDGHHVTFTPALLERLRRQPWPTNLTGLAGVVGELVESRRGPVVEAGELDEVVTATVRRRLTPVEWLLRAAIVDALRAHGGNKDLAAASLGMSRASIYRKIKSLDIDVPSLVRD